jgi:capsular exopolysaccharide synthesis family protein
MNDMLFRKTPHPPVDEHLVSFVAPTSFEAEQYRRLRQQVELAASQRRLQVIAVTSPVVGDGKTLTAVNLTAALSRKRDRRVLIVDADLRRPSVAATLGLAANGTGLTAALHSANRPLSDFIEPVKGTTLEMLAGRTAGADTYELLTSARLSTLLSEARTLYDYVIIDTPPLIAVADGGLLREVVDGYLVVVAARATPRKLLGESLSLLDPSSVIGLVFNRDDRPLFGFYRSHYRRYFRSYVRSVSANGNQW